MKRNPILWLCLTACLSISLTSMAQESERFVIDGVRYLVIDAESRSVAVDGIVDDSIDFLFCQDKVNHENVDYTVTAIGNRAFEGKSSFYYIHFPPTLTGIGSNAFNGCSVLTFDELPEGLVSIGESAFTGCDAIERITLPSSVEHIGAHAFENMASLQRMVMQDTRIEEIPSSAFANDKNLEELYLPLSVKSIGDNAFSSTYSLASVYFPEGLETIGAGAFQGLPYGYDGYAGGLQSVTLPSTITALGEHSFSCPAYSIDLSKCSNLTDIPDYAFSHSYNLTSVKLPDNLEKIGKGAFLYMGCNGGVFAIALEIPQSVKEIGEDAFSDSKISSIRIGNEVAEIPVNFANKVYMLDFGEKVKKIASSAFSCDDLRLIRLRSQVPPSFTDQFNLTDSGYQNIVVIVNDGLIDLYRHHPTWSKFNLVEETKSKVDVVLDGSMGLGEAIYAASGVLPSRVSKLKVSGHLSDNDLKIIRENMLSLSVLDLSNTDLTEIKDSAFKDMTLLREVKLPDSIEVIGDHAFENCTLMNLTRLPDSLRRIGTESFCNCQSITITELPDVLETIGYRAFSECKSLRSITAGENLSGRLDVTFSSCTMLEYVDLSKTKVDSFYANTFYICSNLKTVLLPPGLTNLANRDFAISGIRSLVLPGSIRTVGEEVFLNTPLRAIAIGEGVENIAEGFFGQCNYLTTVSLPASTKSIAANVFSDCSRLKFISCAAPEAPRATSASFNGIQTQKAFLTIPRASFGSYLNAVGWGSFGNIDFSLEVEVPEDVDVTAVTEDDYKELEEDQHLLAEQAANSEIPNESPARRQARISSVANQADELLSGRHFAKVFNGASIRAGKAEAAKGIRFFIHGEAGVDYEEVLLNDVNVTDQVTDGYIVLSPEQGGKLRITPINSAVDGIAADSNMKSGRCSVYSISGALVSECESKDLSTRLGKGVYVVRYDTGRTKKMIVH
ncbi:MAG: leucine-rich repeat protein [Muribaculaceae bacterium]|nr:leucine-rich repeat protein [Muribaculaceae bacterium]